MADLDEPYLFLTASGVADPGQEGRLAELTAILQRPDAKILLHLHGGLVDKESGLAAARRLAGAGNNSWNLGPGWTQVYVIWRTGFLETIRENWKDLLENDRLYQAILRKLLGFVARKLGISPIIGARGASSTFRLDEQEIQRRMLGHADREAPFADLDNALPAEPAPGARSTLLGAQTNADLMDEFERELARDPQFQRALADLDAVVNEGAAGRTVLSDGDRVRGAAMANRLDPKIRAELQWGGGLPTAATRGPLSVGAFMIRHAGRIAWRCFKRFRSGRDHGFHATVVEEICRELYGDLVGAAVWGMMVNDAAQHFDETGLGKALLRSLSGHQPEQMVVTAHSAGSIWAARMLLAMNAMGVSTRLKLFLLAPAVRTDLFAQTITTCGSLIDQCHMFTMNDATERADPVLGRNLGYIYPSSLLYLISGLFEERDNDAYADAPLLGMQRFAGVDWLEADEARDAATIATFFQRSDHGINYAPTPGVTLADSHGAFDDEKETLASVRRKLVP